MCLRTDLYQAQNYSNSQTCYISCVVTHCAGIVIFISRDTINQLKVDLYMPNSSENFTQTPVQAQLLESATEKAASAVSQEFQKFLADIESLAKSLATLTGAELDVAKAQLAKRVASAKVVLATAKTNVSQRACSTMEATDAYVHEKPWQAVGAGTAIGLLLGMILARRN